MKTAPRVAGVAKALIRAALWFCASNVLVGVLAAQCINVTQVPNQTISSGTVCYSNNDTLAAAGVTINGSASVTFVAGHTVHLTPGFHATAGTAGTTFQAWVETAPTADSVEPSTGSGNMQAFTWTVSSPSGYANLAHVYALFNTSVSGANACYIYYSVGGNWLFLADNSGTVWTGGFTPGSSGSAGNSQCTIFGSYSSVSASGTQLSVTVAVSFQASFAGTKNNYLIAHDQYGLNSEWQPVGTWTVPGGDTTPPVISNLQDSPTSTSATVTWNTNELSDTQIEYGTTPGYGSWTALNPSMVTSHSQVITGLQSGTTYYYRVRSRDASLNLGTATDWFTTASVNQPPTAVSVVPSSGDTLGPQGFQFTYSDPDGYADLTSVYGRLNSAPSDVNACSFRYYHPNNWIYFFRDDGVELGPYSLPLGSPLQNSQCRITAASASAVTNALTLSLTIEFFPTFGGPMNIYLQAVDAASATSGWQDLGDWTVPGVGGIKVMSRNRVSPDVLSRRRFEPSSSVGGAGSTWVTSWEEYEQANPLFPPVTPRGFTSSWAGSWPTAFEHTLTGHRTGDLYLMFNPTQGRHNLTMIDLEGGCTLGFRTSTDASGNGWNPSVVAAPVADYPSVAVSADGTIVIGYNRTNCFATSGFDVGVSTNGGLNWSAPYPVTNSEFQTFGRIVASGNTFHYLYVDRSNSPTFALKRKESVNGGITWVGGVPAVLDSYTLPKLTSFPDMYCADPPTCNAVGVIHYATNIDAGAAPGLGWVVAYAAARSDDPSINNLKFCAENLAGCTTISYPTDLFLQGITTSSTGDLYLAMHTYASETGRTLPLRQIAVYRKPDGTFLNAVTSGADPNIDPTSWALYPIHEICGSQRCFIAGDYMRISMNTLTGATLPFIRKSARNQTDLMQSFVKDPPGAAPGVPGLQIGLLRPFGSDSRFPGGLSPLEVQRRFAGTRASVYYLRGGR